MRFSKAAAVVSIAVLIAAGGTSFAQEPPKAPDPSTAAGAPAAGDQAAPAGESEAKPMKKHAAKKHMTKKASKKKAKAAAEPAQ